VETKSVLITGAGRGIGCEIARALAADGYQMILIDKHFPDDFESTVELMTKENIPHLILQVDVSKKDERAWLLSEIKQTFGSLYGIVNNAGIHNHTQFQNLTEDMFDTTLDINVKGAVFLTQEMLPLIKDTGSIVFISSARAFIGSDHGVDYAVSKAGMIGATRSLAVELSPRIRVNAIAPFSIDTPMIAGDDETERQERFDHILLDRIGTPQDVAHAVRYLLAEDSSYVTGQVIHVNGGAYFGG